MRSIKKNLAGVVHVYVDGQAVFLSAGDAVPDGVVIREDVLATDEVDEALALPERAEETDETETASEDDAQDDEMPAESDSREEWNIYAESVGVNPAEFSKKESLIEALKQR
ncbi:hypothetical protein [Corynebacterium stationis]|uniref:Uncharacterized protein n=1 Tax=Corynebacterium stationis TaxID=1705 RepID=A0AB36CLN0_9CORY|nr:hypothetical protein [Corynebacterium stationis]NME89562.1 hypothetical protein [Corynebacterium stationis]